MIITSRTTIERTFCLCVYTGICGVYNNGATQPGIEPETVLFRWNHVYWATISMIKSELNIVYTYMSSVITKFTKCTS